MDGWISIHRQIEDSEIWFGDKFNRAHAWIDLLLLASHKPRTFFIRGIEIKIERGQLAYSQLSLAKRWMWNIKTVVRYLNWLKNKGMVETKTDNITTIITILNYNLYQNNGDQRETRRETRRETYNKDNKIKKVNKEDNTLVHFQNFYTPYPRKEAKQDALKAWITLNPDEALYAVILEALKKHKDCWVTEVRETKHIPLPASWLRGRRWEDEINNPKPKETIFIKPLTDEEKEKVVRDTIKIRELEKKWNEKNKSKTEGV